MTENIYPLSNFNFNNDVSTIFDKHVRDSIPFYDEIQKNMVLLSDYFLTKNSVFYDLGCSTGETLFNILTRHKSKDIVFYGIDTSEHMLKQAYLKLPKNDDVVLIQDDILSFVMPQKSDLVVLNLVLHFIPKEMRFDLIKKIQINMNKGSALIIVDKCFASSSQFQYMFDCSYHDLKEIQGLTNDEIRKKEQSIRGVLTPFYIEDYLNIFSQLNLKSEVFYKNFGFTGFICIKD